MLVSEKSLARALDVASADAENMTGAEAREQLRLACDAVDYSIGNAYFESLAIDLRIAAIGLHAIGVIECNGVPRWNAKLRMRIPALTEDDQNALYAAYDELTKQVESIVADTTNALVSVEFQGDPRGCSFFLISEDTGQRIASYW